MRAINALLTVGRGQRMGLFAGTGVGKSVLLGMMARYTSADVIVVGLIGERGREVKEFIEQILGDEGLARSVVVAAPADNPPLMRLQGAAYATAIAEHFRDQGKNVLLIMDSLTRYAMAQREIALAIGEPPATKGYPPSVFAKLPQLVERAGNGREGGGSITAFYTVLTEGDDQQDPIADAARAILDGHIVLIAHAGRSRATTRPSTSSSRSAARCTASPRRASSRSARRLKQLYLALPAQPRPDQRGRLRRRQRPDAGPGDCAASADRALPAAGHPRAVRPCRRVAANLPRCSRDSARTGPIDNGAWLTFPHSTH